ncbi:MAG TPA: PAS domain S-box protein [Chloroflexota bacterium]|jgi:PAS domain S-box-containing protein|nr:PAS domain S-box protein [Chloroflexota bacterium]
MPLYDLGPRTIRIYQSLVERIRSGELPPGAQLPPHKRLASDFGVAPMTIRQVLARLEEDGLVSRQVGRGTFVRAPQGPRILIVASAPLSATLADQVTGRTAHAVDVTASADEAAALLAAEPGLSLVLIEVGPGAASVDTVRTIRRRWPRLAVAAVVATMNDLLPLQGTPECPVLVLSSPPRADQVSEVVRLAVASTAKPEADTTTAGMATLTFQARLLESVEHAIIATTAGGEILYWNKGAEQLYGWRADEVMGKNLGQVVVAPEQYELGMQIMDGLRRGETWSGEFQVRHRDSRQIPVLVTDSPIRDSDGNLIGIIGVSIDLTERKHAERNRLALARLETALLTSRLAQREISQKLAVNMAQFGRLAEDPALPAHLRPIAGTMLRTVEDVVDSLAHAPDMPQPD